MQLNTTSALATAVISAIIGFGLAFYIERKLSGGMQKKSQKILTSIAMISFGYGLMATLNEVIGFPLQGLSIRYDKLAVFVVANMLFLPIIFLAIAKLIGLKNKTAIVNVQQRSNFNEQASTGFFSKFKNYLLLVIPAVVLGAYFFDSKLNSDSKNELLSKDTVLCEDLQKDAKQNSSKNCTVNTQKLMTEGEKSISDDLLSQIKYCELLFDSDANRFTYKFHPSIKYDKTYVNFYTIYKGKEGEVGSWHSLLRQADKEGRTEEAKRVAGIIRENSISIYHKKYFSTDFVSKLYFDTNAVEMCEVKRRNALTEYAKSDLIEKISKEERIDIFNKYIRNDSAYVNSNLATQSAIRLRYKIED
jgi:hypothetical protein